jgi:hypothetical protein
MIASLQELTYRTIRRVARLFACLFTLSTNTSAQPYSGLPRTPWDGTHPCTRGDAARTGRPDRHPLTSALDLRGRRP